MLVIADAEKPVAVAGVMGGEYSGIMDDTTTVVFESACFDGASVRTTAKKLGMRTDASARYEKGLDPHECYEALMRAFQLVEELGAGALRNAVVDGDVEYGSVMAGQIAGLVRKEETCAEILEDLYTGAAKVIKEEAARWADVNV